jgi:hypothetical protein
MMQIKVFHRRSITLFISSHLISSVEVRKGVMSSSDLRFDVHNSR